MAEKWDYQLRKVEIAKVRLGAHVSPNATRENFKKVVQEALSDSWEMVDNVFPRCD